MVILRHLFLSFGCESKRVFLLKQIWKKARLYIGRHFEIVIDVTFTSGERRYCGKEVEHF